MIFLAIVFVGLVVTLCGSGASCVRHWRARRDAARLMATLPALTTIAIWDGPPDSIPFD